MSAADAVLAGRREAEALMVDTCRITSVGTPVTDPDTGNVTTPRTTVYEGKCKVQSKDSAVSSPEAGGATFTVVSRQVHIPANAAEILDGHEVEILTSLLNSFTVGKVYRVDGFTPDTYDTAYRIPVKEITS
ncbi:hypothetical protein QFZ30_002462 [Arthrobacter pascens]|uniref:DUF6093 family protein n=1 Tax=Arthrobacter pascens TaxID=1677 RepID=UPI00278E2EC7|nr:DUF6093 family protein [Arthrobacter pascens]MDQ0679080.1 hypothetical protein [Arthrobacter pascens]